MCLRSIKLEHLPGSKEAEERPAGNMETHAHKMATRSALQADYLSTCATVLKCKTSKLTSKCLLVNNNVNFLTGLPRKSAGFSVPTSQSRLQVH